VLAAKVNSPGRCVDVSTFVRRSFERLARLVVAPGMVCAAFTAGHVAQTLRGTRSCPHPSLSERVSPWWIDVSVNKLSGVLEWARSRKDPSHPCLWLLFHHHHTWGGFPHQPHSN
jgi:hypothetical protein